MSYLLLSTLAKGEKYKRAHENKVKDKIICKLSEKLFVIFSGGGYASNLLRNTMKQIEKNSEIKNPSRCMTLMNRY